jgi:hypothetical protein
MTHEPNFREPNNHRTRFIDDTPSVSRVRRMIQTLRRAQADATYLNQRMLELPE